MVELFLLQLFVNLLWHILMFGRHIGIAAILVAAIQVVLAGVYLVALNGTRRFTGILVAPNALWMLYLLVLTVALWHRNPTLS